MKMMKKVLAMLLATAMILTGLYIVPGEAAEVKATESGTGTGNTTVNTDMLNVKFQTAQTPITDESDANNGKYVMRFIASVDSLDYSAVGFEVTSSEGTAGYNDSVVFERIDSEDENVSYEFSPKVVDTSSEYFVTARMYATPGVNYTIRAYVVSLDGTTTTYGGYRCVSAEDGLNGVETTNISFVETTADTYATGTTYDISSSASSTGAKATVFAKNGTTVHARVNVAPSALPSATKFTFGSGETAIYRNLYTTHVPTEGTTPVADKTWYEVYGSSEDAYIIATGADLYGLAAIVDENEQLFASKTIYVVSDIAINSTGTKTYEWNPIGTTEDKAFAGVFDGQLHAISGVHINTAEQGAGLFGYAGKDSLIQKIEISDSSITSTKTGEAYVGSIVGYTRGNVNLLHVDNSVTVTATGQEVGGIIGRVDENQIHTITECQFDGTVTTEEFRIGGIVGRIYDGQVAMENCLNKGTVSNLSETGDSTNAWTGGLIGGVHGTSTLTFELNNSLNVGAITTKDNVVNSVGSLIGRTRRPSTIMNSFFESGTVSCGTGVAKTNDTVVGVGNYSTNSNTVSGAAKERSTTNLKGALARYNTGFDYYTGAEDDGVWVAQNGGYPILKAFADSYYAEDVTMTADTSWYDKDPSATSFYISTPAEFLGLAKIANETTDETYSSENFNGNTITLTADLTMNLGKAKDWEKTEPKNMWSSIGSTSKYFIGNFDGQGHTISGIYLNTTGQNQGLFGATLAPSGTREFKNFSLVNSYIVYSGTAEYAFFGGIIGRTAGAGTMNIQDIYSDVIINGTNTRDVGGIIGVANESGVLNISRCQFDGELYCYQYAGGMIGRVIGTSKTVNITNCLSTGYMEAELHTIGGLCGNTSQGSGGNTININTSVSNCEIHISNKHCSGTVISRVMTGDTANINNVYTTKNITAEDGTTVETGGDIGVGNNSSGSIAGTKTTLITTTTTYELDTSIWTIGTDNVPYLTQFAQ